MKLIDKDALVEEIDKVIDEPAPSHDPQCPWEDGYYCGLYKAESILDTFEVKDVDFEKEIRKYLYANDIEFIHQIKLLDFAKHFFELGLKATQKGDTLWN